jgi:hypothetical protein
MIILGGSVGVHIGDTVGKGRSKAILDATLPPSSQLKELLERKR